MSNPKVTVIPATVQKPSPGQPLGRKMKVAAYCRVSSEKDQQLSSFEVQVKYYTEKINGNPEWKMVDIYADEGITGTSMKKRDDFKRMLRACREGRVDLILVKSVSRFGRNTVDVMKTVRSLQEKGIGVIFEEQGIDTRTMNSELMLAFHSAFSQSESESIRENVRWGYQRSFQNGKVSVGKNMLGFAKDENGEILIDEEQAETVRRIFALYLQGLSLTDIKKQLELEERLTARGGKTWNTAVIQSILQNEKYKGDALLQKTYRPTLFSGRVENNGVLPKYYVSDCLPRIVDPETFDLAQEEMRRRTARRAASEKAKNPLEGKYSGRYALSSLLICENCGSPYKRVTWNIRGKKKIVWRCTNRVENGTKYCADSPSLEEGKLQAAIMETIQAHFIDKADVEDAALLSIDRAINGEITENETAMRTRLNQLKQQKKDLVQKAMTDGDDGRYDLMFTNILNEMNALSERLNEITERCRTAQLSDSRIAELRRLLGEYEDGVMEYNDGVIHQMVQEIRVHTDGQIDITFVDGSKVSAMVK